MADEDLDRHITHPVKYSDQEVQSKSFDQEFNLAARLLAAYHVTSDTVRRVACDVLGRLQVVMAGALSVNSSVLEYASASTVPANTLTTILTYTNTGSVLWLDQLIATGQDDAEYEIVINTVTKIKYRTSEQQRTMDIQFPIAQKIAINDVIDIKVTHWGSATRDFDASLIGHKE
jgi:hypothetical protein